MPIDPDELLPPKPKQQVVVGEDITRLSVAELQARIAALEEEIDRTRQAIAARDATRSAADAVFKR